MQKKYTWNFLSNSTFWIPNLLLHHYVHQQNLRFTRVTLFQIRLNSVSWLEDYRAFTRLDISYVVNCLWQFMHQPTTEHWTAAKRVLRYLSRTLTHGILMRQKNPLTLHVFSDVDLGWFFSINLRTTHFLVITKAKRYLDLQQKLNIGQWQIQQQNYDGSAHS